MSSSPTPNAVRIMSSGAKFPKEGLVVRLLVYEHLGGIQGHDYLQAHVSDGTAYTSVYVLCKKDQELHQNVDNIVRVQGYVTNKTDMLIITSLDILRKEQTRVNNLTAFNPSKRRVSFGNFFLNHTLSFSDQELTGESSSPSLGCEPLSADLMAVNDFMERHTAMKALSSCKDAPRVATEYMKEVKDYAHTKFCSNRHRQALAAALDLSNSNKDLTCATLKQWHALLEENSEFHSRRLYLEQMECVAPQKIPSQQSKLCKTLHRMLDSHYHVTTVAATACLGIATIHPFADNSLVLAELVTNWVLCKKGLCFVITSYDDEDGKRSFLDAIQVACRNLSLHAKGDVPDKMLHMAMASTSMLRPLVQVLLQRITRCMSEFDIRLEKARAACTEEYNAQIARQVREKSASGVCLICFDNGPNIATLCCGKAVHFNCLATWLRSKSSCPQCRATLPKLTTSRQHVVSDSSDSDYESSESEDSTHFDWTSDSSMSSSEDESVSFCEFGCGNLAAADCTNGGCGRCCVTCGYFSCVRHDHVGFFDYQNGSGDDSYSEEEDEEEEDDDDDDGATNAGGIYSSSDNDTVPTNIITRGHHHGNLCDFENCRNLQALGCHNNGCSKCCQLHGTQPCARHGSTRGATSSVPVPLCSFDECGNRAASGCDNHACGRCCADRGRASCIRHNHAFTPFTVIPDDSSDDSLEQLFCSYGACRNKAAFDCDNGCCKTCCLAHGLEQCTRHGQTT